MNDTQEAGAGEVAIPNFSARVFTVPHDGGEAKCVEVTFGEPQHKIVVRELDLVDQFDLLEISGEASGNAAWMGMAMVAASLREIDGMPVPKATQKAHLRVNLKRIPPLGLRAISKGIAQLNGTTDEALATAKN
jgi:hypothetical protein